MSRYTRFPANAGTAGGANTSIDGTIVPSLWRRPSPAARQGPNLDSDLQTTPGASAPEVGRPHGARPTSGLAAGLTPGGAAFDPAPAVRVPWQIWVFLLALAAPFTFDLGPLSLSPARLFLLVMIVPLFIGWMNGACGPKRLPDWLLLAYLFWQTLSWIAWGGLPWVEYAGSLAIEALGAYLVARRYVRDEGSYLGMIRVFLILGIVLGAAAAIEALTGKVPLTMLFDRFFDTHPVYASEYRMGMRRAQTSFEHPILSGLFVLAMFGPLWTALRVRRSWVMAALGVAPVMAGVFFSLSTGAFLGLTVQTGILAWGMILHRFSWRWKLLAVLAVTAYVGVDLLSNRTPFEVFVSYGTFNQGTGYHRILIFIYGMEHVWVNPILGSGFDDWARPSWLHSSSVDNFWLAMAMRHGVPGFLLIFGFYATSIIALIRARPASRAVRAHREGIAIMLVAMFLSLCTVHVWSASFTFIMFTLGLFGWVADAPRAETPGAPAGNGLDVSMPGSAGRASVRPATGAA